MIIFYDTPLKLNNILKGQVEQVISNQSSLVAAAMAPGKH